MTDTKLEPELPQATFFITGEIGKPMIPAYTAEQVRAAIEADRNKRAPLGSLTDEQIVAAAHNADGIGRVSLTLINNDGAEVPTFVAKQFARALLSSVAPRVPDGWRKFGAKVLADARENLGADVDGGDIQDWAEEAGLLVKHCVSESCGEHCICAEVGFPSDCYRYSDEAMEAVNAIAAPQPTQEG
ncbi:MAG TPA: hypothetical protein VJ654_14590 [Noviherbaspirillum sp.]|nr:hypothetical protein [Noviherbaspirillum sp.]